jgi:hypothetical protein
MAHPISTFLFALATGCVALPVFADGVDVSSSAIDKSVIAREHLTYAGELVSALSVQDKNGRHILLLTSITGPSKEKPNPHRVERTDLRASFFSKANNKWAEEWSIKDFVDCPGLDSSASFFANNVTVTDVNGDGAAEITVPYKMFCGGGVDPDTVKVILRQGAEKFAFRGESLVSIPGQAAFGGSYTADKDLSLPKNAAYKKHINEVWLQVYIHSYRN